jgi:uncharacterized membrane protein
MTTDDLKNGVTVTGETATAAAPLVALFNPAAGAALGLLAPLAEKLLVSELGAYATWKANMTKDDVIKALEASKSSLWPTPPSIV